MRLSAEAKDLLDTNRITELQALALEKLLHPAVYEEYLTHCANPLPAISVGYTVYPSLIDSMSLDSLTNAAVVSNGFIHSQESIESLEGSSSFKCPLTRQSLLRKRFGPEGAKRSFVNLPQVDAAMTHFRRLRDLARGAAAAALLADPAMVAAAPMAAAAGGAGAMAGHAFFGVLPPRLLPRGIEAQAAPPQASAASDTAINSAIAALSGRGDCLNLRLKVSGSKLRVLLNPRPAERETSPLNLLAPYFAAAFAHSPASKISSTATSYHLQDFGRCWLLGSYEARLEFWFPIDAQRLTDAEVNRLNNALLSPLHLAAAPPPPGIAFGSISTLGARDYKDAFPEMEINIHQAATCLNSFMLEVQRVATNRGIALNDRAVSTEGVSIPPATHSGLMLFGAAPVASIPSVRAATSHMTMTTTYR